MAKRLYIQTFGCQMNVHDSDVVEGLLADDGYVRTDDPQDADLIFVNTCSVRDKAEHKLFSQLGLYGQMKQQNPRLRIAVGGCVAQQRREEVLRRAPYVNYVVGTHQFRQIAGLIHRAEAEARPTAEPRGVFTQWRNRSLDERFEEPAWSMPSSRHSAYVTVMEGCDNTCSFCIVPFTRGREVSRRPADILRAVEDRVRDGAREIVLLGQNVNAYGRSRLSAEALADNLHELGPSPFAGLLHRVARIEGVERIRYTSPHPADMDDALIDAHGRIENLCPYIHLPVQSGSNRILEAMRRSYTREHYLERVTALRRARPDLTVSTDIIVGFPGETDADFRQTLELMEEASFDQVFAFVYSPRPMTVAAKMPDDLPDATKDERLQILLENQRQRQRRKNEALVGLTFPALMTEHDRLRGVVSGRTAHNRIVHCEGGADHVGRIVGVTITKANPNSLLGVLAENPAPAYA